MVMAIQFTKGVGEYSEEHVIVAWHMGCSALYNTLAAGSIDSEVKSVTTEPIRKYSSFSDPLTGAFSFRPKKTKKNKEKICKSKKLLNKVVSGMEFAV